MAAHCYLASPLKARKDSMAHKFQERGGETRSLGQAPGSGLSKRRMANRFARARSLEAPSRVPEGA